MNILSTARLSLLALIVSCAGAAACTLPVAPAAAADGPQQKLAEEKSPALVTIKFILKGGEQDEEVDTTGVIIDPSGLVLGSNNAFGGLMARFGGPAQTPTEIKVLIGDDTQGVEARFVARDTELGLAWVQLKDAPAKPLASIDLSKTAVPKVGESVYQISLMGKFFDRAPMVSSGFIGAIVKKPRELYIPSIGLASRELGLPIFNEKGELLGVTTIILPDKEEISGEAGGIQAAMRGITGGMILPAAEVASATKRAKETPAAAAPAEGEKKDDAKPAGGAESPK